MNERLVPEGGENPYAKHPGFDAQECSIQYVVTPATSVVAHGFGCSETGGHCVPGAYCDARRASYAKAMEADALRLEQERREKEYWDNLPLPPKVWDNT